MKDKIENQYLRCQLNHLYNQAVQTKRNLSNKNHHIGDQCMAQIMDIIDFHLDMVDEYERIQFVNEEITGWSTCEREEQSV